MEERSVGIALPDRDIDLILCEFRIRSHPLFTMDNNIGIPDQFIIELPWPDGIPCIRISMGCPTVLAVEPGGVGVGQHKVRSEEHTSELQSRGHLVCRLLLEKKKTTDSRQTGII